jgi:endo-1,4-beta-mannosidase
MFFMEFILGCNYWASHAGTEMWVDWDLEKVRQDMSLMKEYGIRYIRVFPNWRDFQPVKPLFHHGGNLEGYYTEKDQKPTNPYYLDDIMMERFQCFCDVADQYGIKLIVGLLTGWMSGRLFIPSALYGKNLFSDPVALLFEQKFVQGFVDKFKNHSAIYAWDLGNECNCMSEARSREEAANWTAIISNAIRAKDPNRMIISGMHSLTLDGIWTIADQAQYTDILTTHPYPYWVPHCSQDRMDSMRTLLHATSESQLYRSVGKKPCLVEELGTMGPMVCDDETAADFMRINLFSNWAHGQLGVLWWCAFDQNQLTTPPYSWNMCERELGLFNSKGVPKLAVYELKRFSEFLEKNQLSLTEVHYDAVCILTKGQDHWGVAYMTYILAKQAGRTITFCYAEDDIPKADIYLIPSITGHLVMTKSSYEQMKQYVRQGSTVYLSNEGFLTEFEEFVGMKVIDSEEWDDALSFSVNETVLSLKPKKYFHLRPTSAKVISSDHFGNPCFSVNQYGEGKVYYLNCALEEMLVSQKNSLLKDYYRIYQAIFNDNGSIAWSTKPHIGVTVHSNEDEWIVIAINYSNNLEESFVEWDSQYQIQHVYYGQMQCIQPFEACVFSLVTKTEQNHCNS